MPLTMGASSRAADCRHCDLARPHKYENPSLSDGRGSQLETTGECFSVNFVVRVQPRSHQLSPTSPQARKSFWNRLVGGFRIAPPTIGSSTVPPGSAARSRCAPWRRRPSDLHVHRRRRALHRAVVGRSPAQELGPDRLGFGRADFHAQNLMPAVAVDADGDDDGKGNDAPAAADLQEGGIDSDVWPVTLNRPVEERLHLDVYLLA